MKLFIYKTVIVAFITFILFEVTIGYRITKYKNEIYQLANKENINKILDKARKELKDGIEKDQYFSNEDRDLLSTFIKKIAKELEQN
tara:strand:- start:1436 stop:1696 length:261 start_codon:yes stop_codon:yes gene_type:complete